MNKVTIYLEDEVEAKVTQAAESTGLSNSEWMTNAIKDKLENQWPESIVKATDTWDDFPSIDELRKNVC